MAKTVTGRASWFGGGNDPGNSSRTTASGRSDSFPGVAVRPGGTFESGRPTLGGYWLVSLNGKKKVIRQTDLGPHESTGRTWDLTPAALKRFGLSTSTFKTDSTVKGTFLDMDLQEAREKAAKLGAYGGSTPRATRTKRTTTKLPGTSTTTTDDSARRAAILGFVNSRPDQQLDAALAVKAAPVVTTTTRTPGQTITAPNTSGAKKPGGWVAKAKDRAAAIDSKRLPYQWGGGHAAGRVNAYKAKPLDCSGAVSAVVGINPRVSGQFETWGRPGDGGSKGVTIYANAKHVFMKIDGHFFGTSASNPGGGAGWIPQSQMSPEYLKGFTVRHSNRR